jgi:hypothetical protein
MSHLALVPETLAGPNAQALVIAFTNVLRIIQSQPPSRQRQLAITSLEEAFIHAVFGDVGIDSPIRTK